MPELLDHAAADGATPNNRAGIVIQQQIKEGTYAKLSVHASQYAANHAEPAWMYIFLIAGLQHGRTGL